MKVEKVMRAYNKQAAPLKLKRATRKVQKLKGKPVGSPIGRQPRVEAWRKLTATKLDLVDALTRLIAAHDVALQTLSSLGEKMWSPHCEALRPARKLVMQAMKDLSRD